MLSVGEVEPVPDDPAGIDRVLENCADRAGGPVATQVPGRINVAGGGRTTRPVEFVCDRLGRKLAADEQVEDLFDYRRLLGVRFLGHPALVAVAAMSFGHGLQDPPVSVGRAAPGPVTLLGGLAHSALGLARQLRSLKLVPELLHSDHHAALGRIGIAAASGVVDRDPDLAEFEAAYAEFRRVQNFAANRHWVSTLSGLRSSIWPKFVFFQSGT